jgi:sarcosine oxidase subunit beta
MTNDRVSNVRTTRGTISTRLVVNAAGPWAAQIGAMVGLEIPVLPYRRHVFIAGPAEASRWVNASSVEVPHSRIMVIDFDASFYFHREASNVLFGMADPHEPSTFDTTVSWEFLETVTPGAIRRLPALANAVVTHAWAGLYEVTPDAMPIIGPSTSPNGFFLINGFSGHGFQHSPAAGRVLADMIVGNDPRMDVAPFALDRFGRQELIPEGSVV